MNKYGGSGHTETVLIEYYSDFISYEMLLDVFFRTHDPTTINRQGNDVGKHYRSAIFYGWNKNMLKILSKNAMKKAYLKNGLLPK